MNEGMDGDGTYRRDSEPPLAGPVTVMVQSRLSMGG